METRENMVRLAKESMEDRKSKVRRARQKALQQLRKAEGVSEDQQFQMESYVQAITDKINAQLESANTDKAKELLKEAAGKKKRK